MRSIASRKTVRVASVLASLVGVWIVGGAPLWTHVVALLPQG